MSTVVDAGDVLAVIVSRRGEVPVGADETVAEAAGAALVVGSDPVGAVAGLPSARRVWCAPTGTSQHGLSQIVASLAGARRLIVMPASPDGRDLAPRVAAVLGRPILAGAVACGVTGSEVWADLMRLDGRVTVPASTASAAVATLWTGARAPAPAGTAPEVTTIDTHTVEKATQGEVSDVGRTGMVQPDPSTMDLTEASRVLGGGAGLVPSGASDDQARAWFALLSEVAAALGASAGATRVVTDAGWMPYDRQIGTTGVTLRPDMYVAFGVSGASQHVGGIGEPRHCVSVNTDAACPMTAMSDLGLVTDAGAVLVELAHRLGVEVPAAVAARSAA